MEGVRGPAPDASARRVRRSQLLAIALLALALRAYPLHVFYIHPDQEWIPIMAMRSLVAGDWRPEMLVYPTGLMYTLRVCYTAAYAVGYLHRRFADRIDFLALFLERPFPYDVPATTFCRPYRFVMPGSAGGVAAHYAVTITHPSLEMFGSVPEQLAKILRQATPLAEFRSLAETDARAVQFDPTDANYTPLRGFDRVERPGPNITIWRIDEQPSDARSARPGRPWG